MNLPEQHEMELADTVRVEVAVEYKTRAWQTIEVDLGPGEEREVDLVTPAIEGVAEIGLPITNQVRCLGINEQVAQKLHACTGPQRQDRARDILMWRVSEFHNMYGGKWIPNKSHAMGSGDEFRVGPHIMIIGLDQKMLRTLNQDGSNGEPYVNRLPGHSGLFLVIPIREWDDAQAVGAVGAKETAPAQSG
jgi:hypothetical protein